MSTAVMVTEGPKIQKEIFSGQKNMPSVGGKRSRKEMAKEIMAKRAGLTEKKSQPQEKSPKIAPESEQVETLIGLLRDAASEDEMRELLESFKDYVKPPAVLKTLTELPTDKRAFLLNALGSVATPEDLGKYKSLVEHTPEKVEDKEEPEAKEIPQESEKAAPVSEAPRAEPEASPIASAEEAAAAPEAKTSVVEELPVQTAETPAGTDYYEFLKSYVKGRAQRRQTETEEQNLQERRRLRPKRHPARSAEEHREESMISTALEFPPTEEMDRISAEITNATDQTYAAWQRVVAYKQLNARTLQKMEELRGFFLKLQRLHNQFEEAKARGRMLFEQKEVELKKSHGPTARYVEKSPSFGMSIGEELEAKGVPIFRGKEVLTPKEFRQFLKERKLLEKQSKLERQQEKRSKKDALRLQNRAKEIAGEYLEKAEEAFGRGDIKQEEFAARRDFAKRLGAGKDIAQTLDIGFGKGILSQDEYLKLKSALVERPVTIDTKAALEELKEALGRGDIELDEFLRRKKQFN